MSALLEFSDVELYYDHVYALKGVSVELAQGETVALIGANGAGKSSILRAITGLRRIRRGTIVFDGKRIYAANGGAGSVAVIDVASNKVTNEIKVGQRPWNMALSPDGKKLYVANGRSNSVSVIDTDTFKVIKDIPVGELPWVVTIPQ